MIPVSWYRAPAEKVEKLKQYDGLMVIVVMTAVIVVVAVVVVAVFMLLRLVAVIFMSH